MGQQYIVFSYQMIQGCKTVVCITGPFDTYNEAFQEARDCGPENCYNDILPLVPPTADR